MVECTNADLVALLIVVFVSAGVAYLLDMWWSKSYGSNRWAYSAWVSIMLVANVGAELLP